MRKVPIVAATMALVALAASFTLPSLAQSPPGLDRLYVLNCGEGVAGDSTRRGG